MLNRYGITPSQKHLKRALQELRFVYKYMPETVGCMKNIEKPVESGGCGAWCCEIQNPQLLYIEFLNTWTDIMNQWPKEKTAALIERAVRTYLANRVAKGCVFWDRETKMCMTHQNRPFACRMYGIMPEEEWKPRYEKLKVLKPNADIRPQCGLIKTEYGEVVTKEESDKWWEKIKDVENAIGVDKARINDGAGGTYRSFHDHILLELFSDKIMMQLTKLRLRATEQEKDKFVFTLMHMMKQRDILKDKKPDEESGTGDNGNAS